MKPGIKLAISWFLVRFGSTAPRWELLTRKTRKVSKLTHDQLASKQLSQDLNPGHLTQVFMHLITALFSPSPSEQGRPQVSSKERGKAEGRWVLLDPVEENWGKAHMRQLVPIHTVIKRKALNCASIFLIFRFLVYLFTSVCEHLPGFFLSHTRCLPGFRNPSSLRATCSLSPS